MESAKRRLIYTLLKLGLPVDNKTRDPVNGLAFAFLEDKRVNPYVEAELVLTGHADGLITVNLAEADDVKREQTRQHFGERQRTLLGHFRHESGHYYYDRLVKNTQHHQAFRNIFGDDTINYEAALSSYYHQMPKHNSHANYISAYAQAHPLEDWAESWAHYLHIVDTLETAKEFQMTESAGNLQDIDAWLDDWVDVSVALNALNRSMGLQDAYPFVYTAKIIEKLHFVHQVIYPSWRPRQLAAVV